MYYPLFIFIGLRYLWNPSLPKFKKIITVLSIITITIIIASGIIIISLMNGIRENFKKNILSFVPHLIVTNKEKYINKVHFPKNILQLKDLEKISEIIRKDVVIKSSSNITMGEIIGIDVTDYKNINNYNIKNISKILEPNKYNAIIGKKLAKKLNIHIGDTIKLIFFFDKQGTFLENKIKQKKFKINGTFFTNNEVDYYQILINKKDSRNFLNYSKNYITGWQIWLKKPLSLEVDEIKKLVHPLIVFDWKSQKGELFKAATIEKYIIFVLFFLFLIITFVNIFVTFTIYTIEKKNTIAILKTQGLLDWKIILIFITLSSSTAIIGGILGTAISLLLIIENDILQYLIHFFFNSDKILIIIEPLQIFIINIISILLAIFSTLYPSWYITKIEPYRILSNE